MSTTRIALVLAYDGTSFAGWQSQDGLRSVQGELERVLSLLSGAPRIVVEGSGRTDAGVHALAQVAHADLPRVATNLRHRLNSMLPRDLRVQGVTPIGPDFHARMSARGKRYRYHFDVQDVASPFRSRFAWHVGSRLDHDAMARAARRFEGERDFASLQSAGSSVISSTREIHRCEMEVRGMDVSLVIEGSGFLRHMVRAIGGSLIEVGRGRHAPEWIDDMLAASDRMAAGPNAPPHGLFLEAVHYPEPFAGAIHAAMEAEDDRETKRGDT